MSEGTFSESWHRIAGQRISLRPDVVVRRQNYRGERWFVLENPFSNEFFRIRPEAYEFIARLRPDRTVQEVWLECIERFPDSTPGQEAVIRLLSQLYFANLLYYDHAADSAQLFERFKKRRQRELRARLTNIMFMRFPLIDPNRFLNQTIKLVGPLISPIGALLWLAVVGMALKLVADNFDAAKDAAQGVLAPQNLVLLYAGLVVLKTFHEFGHAYFCKKFGGEVHVMGVLLMIFTPIPYMDASSAWGFRSRTRRVLVGLAGVIVEVFVAAIAVFIWAKTSTGVVHNLAYNMMIVASVSTLLFNLNPLLRFDGYYILSDLVGIPNLHQRATKQIRYFFERYVFGLKKVKNPTDSRREAAFLVLFGIGAAIYRVIIFGGILLILADRFLVLGLLMALVCLVAWVVTPTMKLIHYLASSPQLERNRARAVASTLGLACCIIGVLQFVPFPSYFRAPGVFQASEKAEVVALASGNLKSIVTKPGDYVLRDQPLFVLENKELDLELAAVQAGLDETQARIRQALQQEVANLKPLERRLETLLKRKRILDEERESLVVRARQNGLWVSPRLNEHLGRWVDRGVPMGMIIQPASIEFTATVKQEDADALFAKPNGRATIRVQGQAGRLIEVSSSRVLPVGQHTLPSPALGWAGGGELAVSAREPGGQKTVEPFFEVRAVLAGSNDVTLLHGRGGKIRFEMEPEPLLPKWIRRLQQVLQKRYQL